MKRNICKLMIAALGLLSLSSCDSLDLAPESSIADSGYWKTADQFSAFNTGIASYFRAYSYAYFFYGEVRSGIYGDAPFGGEATQGYERYYLNTIDGVNPGLSNYGGLYYPINQINLMIAKVNESSVLSDSERSYYLGECYGLRAYLYFHLLRSYGGVIIRTDYTSGTTLDLGNLNLTQNSAEEVMTQIKSDISASEEAFSGDYSFTEGKYMWSLAATKMLKGEVYLWSGKQMGGGTSDYNTAKTALQEVSNSGVSLIDDYESIFSCSNRLNDEVIFAIFNSTEETEENTFLQGYWSGAWLPQNSYISGYYQEDGQLIGDTDDSTISGIIRMSLKRNTYDEIYLDNDPRKRINLKSVYEKGSDGSLVYAGVFPYKYKGLLKSNAATRSYYNDDIIYRYGDCLLLLAEAKALLGEDISTEINAIRKRAYGSNYSSAVAYPNDNGAFYTDNEHVGADSDPVEAVLKERLREMMFEGRRWYDIRLFNKTDKYSTASSSRLLWPIDQTTLTNNAGLVQTEGY